MKLNISPRLIKRTVTAIVVMPIVIWLIVSGGFPFLVLLAFWSGVALYEWFHLSLKTPQKYLFFLLGVVYIGVSFATCYLIRMDHGLPDAIIFMIMIWASDIGAYTSGKLIGGPKLAPDISPNKTWAGLAGAVFFPALVFVIAVLVISPDRHFPFAVLLPAAIGIIIGLAGQAGDLLISLFKRYVQVKDTGDIMPGHGGVLDRIDSMLLAAPVYLGILEWMERSFLVN